MKPMARLPLLLLCSSTLLHAGNWPQFRGPTGQGISTGTNLPIDGGIATCLKAATGEIVWQERVGGNFSASPVFAEGRIYFLGDNGETTIIEAGPEFKVLAKNPLGEKVQASMAIAQGRIFIRTEKSLFCIGGK
jgi:hypothetical protein